MYQKGEKLVIDGRILTDHRVLAAANYGLKEITLAGRREILQTIDDLSRRTKEAKELTTPTVELTPDEAHWMAEAVARQIQLDASNLECDSRQNPLVIEYRALAAFAASQQVAVA